MKLPPVVNKLSTNTGGKKGEQLAWLSEGNKIHPPAPESSSTNPSFCVMLRLTYAFRQVTDGQAGKNNPT